MPMRLKAKQRQHNRNRRMLVALTAITVGALVAVVLLVAGGSSKNNEPRIPSGAPLASWQENGRGGQYVLQILEGNAPPIGVAVSGTVASDTDCQPDAQGINHCHNEIDLANGARILVINNHVMKVYRCLNPGESISLTRINASWVLAKVS